MTVVAAAAGAIFGILPNAIVADIAEADAINCGSHKAGMFFAARSFATKVGWMVVGVVFPSLLLLGRSAANDLGVRLTAVAALVFSVVGFLVFLGYDERSVLATLQERPANGVIVGHGGRRIRGDARRR